MDKIEDDLFTIKKNDCEKYTTFCTIDGHHDAYHNEIPVTNIPDARYVCAKIVRSNNIDKYYIRLNTWNKLHNPVSVYDREDKTLNFGNDNNRFKEVSYNAFVLYGKFLQTKNIAWLNKAQREV